MKSLQGQLLIASPHLPDPNFYRTVVLIVQHHAEGALGLVLNRPSFETVKSVLAAYTSTPLSNEIPVLIGGPIEGPLMAVHGVECCSEAEVITGVHFAAERDHILQIISRENPFRLFTGYSGWGIGQLENEMEVGGWLTVRATSEHIFETPTEHLWKRVSSHIGDSILQQGLGIKVPDSDPRLN